MTSENADMRRSAFIGVWKQYGIGMADDRLFEPGCEEEGYEGEIPP